MAKITEIEGIGPANAKSLHKAGIKTVESLLKSGCTKNGRKELCGASGIDEKKILKWVNMADLFRVKGVGQEYSELLEAAGVDTVKELRNRKAGNLYKSMEEVNAKKKLVRSLPGEKKVESWIKHAKTLSPMVKY